MHEGLSWMAFICSKSGNNNMYYQNVWGENTTSVVNEVQSQDL